MKLVVALLLAICFILLTQHQPVLSSTPTCRGPAYSSKTDVYLGDGGVALSYSNADEDTELTPVEKRRKEGTKTLMKAMKLEEASSDNEIIRTFSKPAQKIVKKAVAVFDVTGPTDLRQPSRVLFTGEKRKECVACGVDCLGVRGRKIFLSCVKRYYYYGCEATETCESVVDADDVHVEAMIGICIDKGGCQVRPTFKKGQQIGSKLVKAIQE